jgi:hypothetical protein
MHKNLSGVMIGLIIYQPVGAEHNIKLFPEIQEIEVLKHLRIRPYSVP